MLADAEVRDRYLLLALEVRKIIDDLVVFVEEGRRPPDFSSRIQDAVESLKRASGERSIFAPLRSNLPLDDYEQIRTVDEVSESAEKQKRIIEGLSEMLNESGNPEAQKDDAFRAIDFFYALERRALHHYKQPLGFEGA